MYSVANNQFRDVDILKHYLIPSIEGAFGDSSDFLFQDTSCHRSKQVKDFLNENGISPIKTMNWLANSPDLNPIENVWKRNIEKRRSTSMDELRLAIRESSGEISLTLCEKFLESMSSYLKAVIRAKGRPTMF